MEFAERCILTPRFVGEPARVERIPGGEECIAKPSREWIGSMMVADHVMNKIPLDSTTAEKIES
jgi:hypothetical protein